MVVRYSSSETGELSICRAAPIGHTLPDIPDMANAALTNITVSVFTERMPRLIVLLNQCVGQRHRRVYVARKSGKSRIIAERLGRFTSSHGCTRGFARRRLHAWERLGHPFHTIVHIARQRKISIQV